LGRSMRKVVATLTCSTVMAAATLLLTLVTPKFIATIAGSVIASVTLVWLLLTRGAHYVELFSVGALVAILGPLLVNTIYYLIWGYLGELRGIRSALETFLMVVRSGVFLYAFVVDLVISFTSILAVIAIVSLMYIGD